MMVQNSVISNGAHQDTFKLIQFLFRALGMLTLVPTYFFTTANDYWMYKFRDPSGSQKRTKLQVRFISSYSIVISVGNVSSLLLTIAFIQKLDTIKQIIGSLCGALLMFGATVILAEVDTDSWQHFFFYSTLIIGFFLTGFCSIFSLALFELASKFPSEYLTGVVSGQSICGIVWALVQIFTLCLDTTSKITGLLYFSVGTIFLFNILVIFLLFLKKSEFFKYHLNMDVSSKPQITKELMKTVLKKVAKLAMALMIVSGCSIMVHPGITSLVVSSEKGNGNKWNEVFFVPVTTFLCYNTFDYCGKELAVKFKKPKSFSLILVMSICRLFLIPLLMLCNEQPRKHLPVVFDYDAIYAVFIMVFAFTNGYFIGICLLQIPYLLSTAEEKRMGMVFLFLFIMVSVGACSFVSATLVKVL